MDKEVVVCTYTKGYYSALKKESLSFVTTWMKPESIMLSEVSQTKTNRAWYHLYVVSKNNINNSNS